MSSMGEHVREAMAHIRFLSQEIGGRGSCTPAERRAAEHVQARMSDLGVPDVRIEPFQGAPSTYRPYALAFAAALLGTALVWLSGGRGALAVAAALQALGASGVGVILSLAARLVRDPLSHTEVWLAFTGCEEVAAYGMAAFLDAHAAELGADATYVILDQVGLGRLVYLTADGLILKRKTHPQALNLARQAAAALPDLQVDEQVGIAYTDAAVATKRGLIALTLVALPPPQGQGRSLIGIRCPIRWTTWTPGSWRTPMPSPGNYSRGSTDPNAVARTPGAALAMVAQRRL